MWRTAKRRKQTCVGALRLKWGFCSSGGVWSTAKWAPRDTVHLHRRPPPASTGYCSSTVDLLQPPPTTVHPWAPVHPASIAPPPATVQPTLSMGSCSTTPPRATVHPALLRLLFDQPSTGPCSSTPIRLDRSGSCSSSGTGLYYHGVLFIQPPPGTVHPTPNNTHYSSRGSRFDRLQLAE